MAANCVGVAMGIDLYQLYSVQYKNGVGIPDWEGNGKRRPMESLNSILSPLALLG